MKEMIFRGVPIKVFPKGEMKYRYIDCPYYLVRMKDGGLFLDVINHGIYITFDGREVICGVLVEGNEHEIKRNFDIEPVTIGALFTRCMIKITEDEFNSIVEGVLK